MKSLYSFQLLLLFGSYFNVVFGQSTCSASSPCAQGCCSSSGNCGFGPDFCGTGCQGTCNAVAECGQYAAAGNETCPLNVCCSYYGFCGTTDEFCTTTGSAPCQNGCALVTKPSCSASSALSDRLSIGYYESWSYSRSCDNLSPENIQASSWTHLNYAFAVIDTTTFVISQMNDFDAQLYPKFTNLKASFAGLKTYISVGGWAAGGQVFSDMVSTEANRQAFITSALQFVRTYAFDGIDIDWEYPAAGDRGGTGADFANYVTFMQELQNAFGGVGLGVTATLPSSYWYLQGFDIKNLEPSVDWFNVMSYDIHGTWDGNNPYTTKTVAPHTNLTEIDQALDLLWRNDIDPAKVVLGLGFYGRSFTLANSACTTPGCPFSGGGNAGQCTGQSGILSNDEIQDIITANGIVPTLDLTAAVKYFSWDNNQWVSYDDADTYTLKKNYANSLCLAGTMAWAIDLDTSGESAYNLQGGGSKLGTTTGAEFFEKSTALNTQNMAQATAFWSRCLDDSAVDRHCPPGFHEIVTGHGKIFDTETYDISPGCRGKQNRVLCLNNLVIETKCNWYRDANGGKNCDSRCPSGTYFLSQNTQPAGDRTACDHGTFVSICCEGFALAANTCPPTSFGSVFSGGVAGSSAESLLLSIASLISKRNEDGEVSMSLDPLTIEDEKMPQNSTKQKKLQRRFGGSSDCNSIDYPLNIGPGSTVINSGVIYGPGFGSGSGGWIGGGGQEIAVPQNPVHTTVYLPQTRLCDGSYYPQACHHYSSVGSRNPVLQTIPCDPFVWNIFAENFARNRYPNIWNGQHDDSWSLTWLPKSYSPATGGPSQPVNCERDEWPPFAFWRDRNYRGLMIDPTGGNQPYVRLLPGSENGGAANRGGVLNFENYCDAPNNIPSATTVSTWYAYNGILTFRYEQPRTTSTLRALVMSYTNMPYDPVDEAYLSHNPCWPHVMSYRLNDPGYAVYTYDQYYVRTGYNIAPGIYALPPASAYTQGLIPPTRRSLQDAPNFEIEEGVIVVKEVNSTRLPTEEEMQIYLGYTKCKTGDCQAEIEENERRFELLKSEMVAQTPVPKATASPLILTDSSEGVAKATITAAPGANANSVPMGSHQPIETMPAPSIVPREPESARMRKKFSHNHMRLHH